ncbi:helix-turn-helix domain-containing protein [Aequorivita sp. H23M31]|uniref:Helix-turn-helix domain-containing protein n=1 Tax=Aequorivita ciconiae TaxID=2494375 RepID=A0A410G0V5_9FLAO|nr:AraC family transcriptional regulator [Aequorivita sp. H23M31]QAA80906.1 helix-turn-helix domain-containing protein [Aequorivita sp. H23M31]
MIVATDQSAYDHIKEAQILIDLGEYDKSITYLNIISQRYQGNTPEVEARILGGLARNYLNLGLYMKAVQFWEKAITLIEAQHENLYLEAVFRNNISLAYIHLNEMGKATENLLQSLKGYPLPETYQKLSELALDTDMDFKKSSFYLSEGTALINNKELEIRYLLSEQQTRELNLAYITEGYAYHYYMMQDFDASLEKYHEVLVIAEKLKRVQLRAETLKQLGFIYKKMGYAEKANSYFADHIRLNDSLRVIMNNSLSIPIHEFIKDEERPAKYSLILSKKYLVWGSIILTVIALVFYFNHRRRRLKIVKETVKLEVGNNAGKNNSTEVFLSDETEKELVQKLEEFEKSDEYLRKDISYSSLVSLLNTNEKYLRQILKRNKNTDYNNYINELRVGYILNKLKSDPEYKNYKISYLAEETGFSSHSKFTSNFKQVVGQTPSEFIHSIRNRGN